MYIDFNKYKRVFAFGCSFTSYVYPTWADIIMNEMPNAESYNFGQAGGGNQFIACRIAEAHTRFKFNETDLVMVMYSTAFREDRFIDGKWRTNGNIYNQGYYDKNFVKNYVDPAGCVVRDLAMMELSRRYLEMLPCDTFLLRAAPIENENNSLLDEEITKIIDVYKDMYTDFPLTLQELMFPGGWVATIERGTPGNTFMDCHPLPIDYYNYLVKLGVNVSDKEYAEKSTEKAFLAKPDNSDWEIHFPEIADRNKKSDWSMFFK